MVNSLVNSRITNRYLILYFSPLIFYRFHFSILSNLPTIRIRFLTLSLFIALYSQIFLLIPDFFASKILSTIPFQKYIVSVSVTFFFWPNQFFLFLQQNLPCVPTPGDILQIYDFSHIFFTFPAICVKRDIFYRILNPSNLYTTYVLFSFEHLLTFYFIIIVLFFSDIIHLIHI